MGFFTPAATSSDLDRLAAEVRKLSKEVAELTGQKDYLDETVSLTEKINSLQRTITDLEIKKDRIEEKHAREVREVEHKVGLERNRQEFEAEQSRQEIDAARREAILEVREENLAQEREAFEKQMEFVTKRFTEEVEGLRKFLNKLMPDVTVALGGGNG